jgi:broad specificity phosphatase PhoE
VDSFYFLRHGQTDWNIQGLLMGQRDIALNEMGRHQAREAAKILAGHHIASLCHSPLIRARETAQIIASQCPCSLYPMSQLSERFWGSLEGEKISQEDLLRRESMLPRGAESLDVFQHRVLEGFTRARVYPQPVLFISHGGVFQVIYKKLGIEDSSSLDNALVVRIFQHLGRWRVEHLS